jgi:hypothetical protein
MTLDHVLKMDADVIDALLLTTLQDHAKYRHLVRLHGLEAQSLLDLLQAVRRLSLSSVHFVCLTRHSVWGSHWMPLSNIYTQAR